MKIQKENETYIVEAGEMEIVPLLVILEKALTTMKLPKGSLVEENARNWINEIRKTIK